MPSAVQLDPIREVVLRGTSGDGGVVEEVADFLVEHLDDAQLAAVLRRIGPRHPPPPGAPPRARLACLGARSIKLVPLTEVELVRSSIAGVHAVTPAGEFYTEQTLTALEASTLLLRCHRQFLVNPERIDEIDLSSDSVGSIRTRSGFTVPVSRRYRSRLKAALRI
jgi:two-component system LytT family response regulator